MKLLILVCILYSVSASGDLNDEQKTRLRAVKGACIAESGVQPDVIQRYASNGQVLPENEEKFGCFSSCLLQRVGILSADGQIQYGVFRSKVPADLPNEKVDQIINRCGSLVGNNLCETSGKLIKCFTEEKAFNILY